MTCSPHNVPYAVWRHAVFSDIFLPRSQIQTPRRRQARRLFSAARALRNRADNKKTPGFSEKENSLSPQHEGLPNTRPSASLPQSPLVALAETHRSGKKLYKDKGTKADHDRLRNNPWAVALASPTRHCSRTGMRMPTEFLTDMGLIRRVTASDEETTTTATTKSKNDSSLWWMPVNLLKEEIKSSVHPNQANSNIFASNGKPRVVRMVTRALAYDRFPEYVGRTGKHLLVKTKSIIPAMWKGDNHNPKSSRVDFSQLVWRDDMASFVFKHMLKGVIKALQETCRYEKIKQDSADIWRELPLSDMTVSALNESLRGVDMNDMATGGVIILGDLAAPSEKNSRDAFKSAFTSTFPDYITIPQTGTMAPVYDLSMVLSRPDLEALRQSHSRFNQRALFFRPDGPKSTEAMLALWRLKGYVMHDVEFMAEKADDTAAVHGPGKESKKTLS
ncbi:hypothetical protein PISL3812_05378 [Talaromyces islandicus]|uniref:Uncharacterized protein n=1 Tax=Talaromyces islandicus TaxID=28573 RepID=A0A0U1LYE8_TALIS|nr:hypothetical protein PISL3812_05378 [Talaromyces islandicus]